MGSPGRWIYDLIFKGDTLISATDSGIGISIDFGNHWYKLSTNFPDNAAVKQLVIQQESLFAALYVRNSTQPNAVWRIPLSDIILSTTEKKIEIPHSIVLDQNYPNPFNPSTTISYEIPGSELVTIKIYDVLGREIETLVNEEKSPGKYKIEFDGSNLSSGIYFYQIKTNGFLKTNKMILLR